jgi:predicted NAD/FAD-dependent oxidoreductase
VADVEYASQFSYVFAYDRALSRPGPFYGARATGNSHPLAWIGFEHDKPGHVKVGHSMVVVQTAPHWTAPRVDRDPDGCVPEVKEWAENVLVCDLRHPEWYDTQRWRYAQPTSALEGEMVAAGRELGLILAGDYVSGVGRVGAAIETGFDAAEQVRALL